METLPPPGSVDAPFRLGGLGCLSRTPAPPPTSDAGTRPGRAAARPRGGARGLPAQFQLLPGPRGGPACGLCPAPHTPSSAHAQLCSNQKPGIWPVRSKAGPLWSSGQWARASCPTTGPGKDALTCHLTRLTSAVWGRGSQGQNTEEAAEVPPDRAPALCLRVRVQSGPHTGTSRGSWRETELLAQLPASTGAAPVGHSGQELTSTGRAR